LAEGANKEVQDNMEEDLSFESLSAAIDTAIGGDLSLPSLYGVTTADCSIATEWKFGDFVGGTVVSAASGRCISSDL